MPFLPTRTPMCAQGFACMSIYAKADENKLKNGTNQMFNLGRSPRMRSPVIFGSLSLVAARFPDSFLGFPCEPVANSTLTSRDARVVGDRLLQILIGQQHYS
jgi:hypothetical protein